MERPMYTQNGIYGVWITAAAVAAAPHESQIKKLIEINTTVLLFFRYYYLLVQAS